MIVVFGSTGTVGRHLLRHLGAAGTLVRAVARTAHQAQELGRTGVDAVVADLGDPASTTRAVQGADHVFVASPPSPVQVTLEGALVDALAGTGAHLVKLAALGYDTAAADDAVAVLGNHARIVEHARGAGVPLTVLAPSGFTTNLLSSAGTVAGGVLYGSAGDGGLSWIDPSDVGAVAAHVLTSPGHEGASYALTGPEVLDHAQVARQLSDVLGRAVQYVDVPAAQFAQALSTAGLEDWTVRAVTELQQLIRSHAYEVVTDEVLRATGREPRAISSWLAEHKESFLGTRSGPA